MMKKHYTLLVILTLISNYIYSADASNPADWMPDASLRAAVRASLGLADNEPLTQAKMRDLTELRAAGRGINNITGLEYATNATTMRLANNQFSNLSPLSELTAVTKLRLQNNDITSCGALSGLTNLTQLFLNGNQITNVSPLSGLSNLVTLKLSGNPIADASPLSSLTNLNNVDITIPDPPQDKSLKSDPPPPEAAVDVDPPGVSITVPSGVQNGAFNATFTFTETVSGFAQSDVSLSGSAASITSWSTNGDATVYTATITPTASGTVTIGAPANVATDSANNQNTAATSKTVTVDVDKPTVTIGVPSDTQTGAFDATITFSEAVSGFTQFDVSLSGSAASITSWSTNGDATVYTATITPTASGTVTIGAPANVATDAANNNNTAATSKTVSVDMDSPGVNISVPSGVQNGAFSVTITFTETVSDFVQADVSLSGTATASITAWTTTDNTAYTATITPTTSGTVTIGVAANVATDAANNNNTAATSLTVAIDIDVPTVSIGVPSGTQTGAFDVSITFTEAVSGFEQADLVLSGTATATITAWNTTDNTVYTATITPTSSGDVALNVAADVATDAAGNNNTAATAQTATVLIPQPDEADTEAPGVSITVPTTPQNSAFSVTITFTEAVSGFAQSDLSLTTNTAGATITSWTASEDNTIYTAEITPTSSGEVSLSIAEGVAMDTASNPNTASETQTVTVDVDPPGVSISARGEVQKGNFLRR